MTELWQNGVPCAIMRGGTSKGVYFALDDLPADESARNALVLRLLGGDARQIDGLGGGDMLTAKVAVVSRPPNNNGGAASDVDLEYRFMQVVPGEARVDTGPTCGNILAGVGAFAIERGLAPAADGETTLRVRDINTGALVEIVTQTPGGRVRYDGDCEIAGAPGRAAPVRLFYLEFAGRKTGALFPTGARSDVIDGVPLTCIDAAMPCVIAPAQALGARGDETRDELQQNSALLARLEDLRLQAAEAMGLGCVRGKVIPKFILARAPQHGGAICARYFTPATAHAAFAVSGGIALSCALLIPGTVAADCAAPPAANARGEHAVNIEHPSGQMQVVARMETDAHGAPHPTKAGLIRTTRLLMQGIAHPPPY